MRTVLAIALIALAASTTAAFAQARSSSMSGLSQGRDCQTIRTCNFTRGGAFRGCVSSYSCRVCRYEPARCSLGGRDRTCRQSVCTWG